MNEAGVMLIVKDGLILGIARKNNRNLFGIPGGKVDLSLLDRSAKDAAIRETKEETSINVKDCVFVYARVELADGPKGIDFYSRCYYATDWEGSPQSVEGLEVKWLTVEELTNSSMSAFGQYNRVAIDKLKSLFPSLYLKGE